MKRIAVLLLMTIVLLGCGGGGGGEPADVTQPPKGDCFCFDEKGNVTVCPCPASPDDWDLK